MKTSGSTTGARSMAQRIRDFDWSKTALGPMDAWPQSLKTAVSLCVNSRFPMMLWWGPELINIYNDGYAKILGKKDPIALGKRGRDVWEDVWAVIEPQVEAVFQRGESTWNDRVHLVMERNGVPEDTWFTWSYSPIRDESGKIMGLLNVVIENTKEVLVERERDRYLQQRIQEQDRARRILESITEAFLAVDRDWRFVYVNPQAEEVLNRKPGELIGRSLLEEYPGIIGSPFEAVYRGAMEKGVGGAVTSYYPEHDRWYEAHAYPGPDGISIYFRNVTEHVTTEAALRASEAQRRLALEGADLGSWHLDPKRGLLLTDARFRAIFGLSEDRTSYEDALATIHPDDLANVRRAVGEVTSKTEPSPYEVEHRVIHQDGSIRWLYVKGRTNLDANGTLISLDGTIADITGRKRAEEERLALLASERQARVEAEQAGRMKDEFLATLSHELRTPLSAILGWSQILQRNTAITGAVKEGLNTIERNARAQTQIIDDLLDMSRIISGKVSLSVQRIDLAMVLRAAIDTVRPTALAKGIDLVFAEPMPDRHPVIADQNRLQQVFWNLLSNAVKFTPTGGVVELRLDRDEAHWQVEVIDSGEGIKREFLPFVFDRFRQADASTTRRHGGLGLGLAIVKQLVELHGGSVRVQSAGTSRGSTFTVLLPAMASAIETDSDGKLRPQGASASVGENGSVRSSGNWEVLPCDEIKNKRILVVDDEPDARSLLRQLLIDCGATVLVAANADEAMESLKRDRPDVIVSDIGMPHADGYELMRRIRRLSAADGGNTPAIALTAYARAEDRMKAVRAGFQMHVPKPVEPAELMTMIGSLLERELR